MVRYLLALFCLIVATMAFPQLPPGIDPASCPNFPFCGPSPSGAPSAPSAAQSQVEKTIKQFLNSFMNFNILVMRMQAENLI